MKKPILAMCVMAAACLGQGAMADSDDTNGKVSICHKGRTVSINSSGLQGHLGHGDSMGSCEDRRSAVVMMQCAAESDGDGIVVEAMSSSPYVDPSVVPAVGADCATALAAMVDAQLAIRAVTAGGNGTTDYLLLGYVAATASP